MKAEVTQINPTLLNKRVYELACAIAKVYDMVPNGVWQLLKHIAEQKDFRDTHCITDCPKSVRRDYRDLLMSETALVFGEDRLKDIYQLRQLAIGKYSLACGSGKYKYHDRLTFSYLYHNNVLSGKMEFFELTPINTDIQEVEGLNEWLNQLEEEIDEHNDEDE